MDLKIAQDSIRCMSNVFDDIALELGIAPHNYGDPDWIFDKIEDYKNALNHAKMVLNIMAEIHNNKEFEEYGLIRKSIDLITAALKKQGDLC